MDKTRLRGGRTRVLCRPRTSGRGHPAPTHPTRDLGFLAHGAAGSPRKSGQLAATSRAGATTAVSAAWRADATVRDVESQGNNRGVGRAEGRGAADPTQKDVQWTERGGQPRLSVHWTSFCGARGGGGPRRAADTHVSARYARSNVGKWPERGYLRGRAAETGRALPGGGKGAGRCGAAARRK